MACMPATAWWEGILRERRKSERYELAVEKD
jgi:hypothetical protein